MKWQGRRKSSNIQDRRGQSPGGGSSLGRGGFPIPVRMGGGIGGIIVLVVIMLLVNGGLGNSMQPATQPLSQERHDELFDFVAVVLADTEDVWNELFAEMGEVYREPQLIVFENAVESACGYQQSAVGPFYCPADQSVYIDLGFYNTLETQFGVTGEFAMAYVVAHEVGHHVQTLLGINQQMNQIRQQVSETEYNRYSVAFELQADYLAGVWAHHIRDRGYLEEGDIDTALEAASAIGDDAIQMQSRGYVVPDSFTHGTSEQRKWWFYHGFEHGNLENGNTFDELVN